MEQKIVLCLVILLTLAAVGLVPLNLLVVSFPEWVVLVTVLAAALSNVVYLMTFETHLAAKILLPLCLVVSIGMSVLGSLCNPYWNSVNFRPSEATSAYDRTLSSEEAREDLAYAMRCIKKCHPLFLDGTPDNVQKYYQASVTRLERNRSITVNDLRREIQSVLSVMGDAHTSVRGKWDDEVYVPSVARRKQEGWRLMGINRRTVDAIFEQNKKLYSYEAESWAQHQMTNDFFCLSGVDYLGLIDQGLVIYTWEKEKGKQENESYTAEDFVTLEAYKEINEEYLTAQEETSFVSYVIDEEKSLALLTLRECRWNQEYTDCLHQMFAEVKAQGIRRVAVDLRGNGGGNSLVANEFLRYLPVKSYKEVTYRWRLGWFMLPNDKQTSVNEQYTDLTFNGHVYVLTDASSFSSAMMFAEYIKDNRLGTLIGEAPGNTPSGYGDIAIFQLPHSGLLLHVSTKQFFRADKECADVLVEPDIPCESAQALDVLYGQIGE